MQIHEKELARFNSTLDDDGNFIYAWASVEFKRERLERLFSKRTDDIEIYVQKARELALKKLGQSVQSNVRSSVYDKRVDGVGGKNFAESTLEITSSLDIFGHQFSPRFIDSKNCFVTSVVRLKTSFVPIILSLAELKNGDVGAILSDPVIEQRIRASVEIGKKLDTISQLNDDAFISVARGQLAIIQNRLVSKYTDNFSLKYPDLDDDFNSWLEAHKKISFIASLAAVGGWVGRSLDEYSSAFRQAVSTLPKSPQRLIVIIAPPSSAGLKNVLEALRSLQLQQKTLIAVADQSFSSSAASALLVGTDMIFVEVIEKQIFGGVVFTLKTKKEDEQLGTIDGKESSKFNSLSGSLLGDVQNFLIEAL